MTFKPDWVSPPGSTIKTILKEKSLSKAKFAKSLNVSKVFVERLFFGDERIDKNLSKKLSETLGSTAKFWLRRDKQYLKDRKRVYGWFGVKYLLKAVDAEDKTYLLKETIQLIQAKSLSDACKRAKRFEPYTGNGFNIGGMFCSWTLLEVKGVFAIPCKPDDGIEVYSSIMKITNE